MRRSLMHARSVMALRLGAPRSVLKVGDSLPQTVPEARQVAVSMQAAAVSVEDLRRVAGLSAKSPAQAGEVAGSTGIGVVREIGDRVTRVSVGDSVLLLDHLGCWADAATPQEHAVFRLPTALPPAQAAALPHLLSASIILDMPVPALSNTDTVLVAAGTDAALEAALVSVGHMRGISVTTNVAAVRGARLAVSSTSGKSTTDVVRRLGAAGMLVVTAGSSEPLAPADKHSGSVALPIAKAIFTDVSVCGFDLLTWAETHREDVLSHLDQLCAAMAREKSPLVLATEEFVLTDVLSAIELASSTADGAKIAVFKMQED